MSDPANVLLLGATSDIAGVVAESLTSAGHRVFLAGRDREALRELADRLNAPHAEFDVDRPETVPAAFEAATEAFGELHGVANMAGSFLMKPAHLTTDEEWHRTIRVNLDSAFYCVRAAGRAMRKGGSVVLMSSVAARTGIYGHEAIAAAKAGVIGLTYAAAATYAGRGLRVNCVAPGLTKTKLTERVWANESAAEASREMHALRRLGEPADVAAAVCFLLDPANAWVTGQVFGVDGGLSRVVTKNQHRG